MRKCHCGRPIERIATLYMAPKKVPKWRKLIGWFKRDRNYYLRVGKHYVCKDCYLEYDHGVSAVRCKCGEKFYVKIGDFYGDKPMYCAWCKKEIKGDVDDKIESK